MRCNYHTKQKERLYKLIKKKNREFSIKEIYEDLSEEVGLTTIYRYIDKLVEEGIINKRIGDNNQAYYHYLESCENENHFYLRCSQCGRIIHIDCDCIEELTTHILKDHHFHLKKEHIMIEGICEKCRKEGILC